MKWLRDPAFPLRLRLAAIGLIVWAIVMTMAALFRILLRPSLLIPLMITLPMVGFGLSYLFFRSVPIKEHRDRGERDVP